MGTVDFATLPANVRAAAFDAALAEQNAKAMQSNRAAQSFDLTADSPTIADAYIQDRGVIAGKGGVFFEVPKPAFNANMATLRDYMQANDVTRIVITGIRNAFLDAEIRPHSVIMAVTAGGTTDANRRTGTAH